MVFFVGGVSSTMDLRLFSTNRLPTGYSTVAFTSAPDDVGVTSLAIDISPALLSSFCLEGVHNIDPPIRSH